MTATDALHMIPALLALALGITVLALPKGTPRRATRPSAEAGWR